MKGNASGHWRSSHSAEFECIANPASRLLMAPKAKMPLNWNILLLHSLSNHANSYCSCYNPYQKQCNNFNQSIKLYIVPLQDPYSRCSWPRPRGSLLVRFNYYFYPNEFKFIQWLKLENSPRFIQWSVLNMIVQCRPILSILGNLQLPITKSRSAIPPRMADSVTTGYDPNTQVNGKPRLPERTKQPSHPCYHKYH